MKKKIITLTVCAAMALCGCSSTDKLTDAMKQAAEQAVQTTAAPTPEITATPAPKQTNVVLGKKGTVGDWEFCVKKAAAKQQIKSGKYMGFKPGKGKTFIVLTMSVRNNGKKAETVFPSVGLENEMIRNLLYYNGEDEYKPTQLLSYDKDLMTKKIEPQKKKNGVVVFEVPKKVAKSFDKLTVKIGTNKDSLLYSLK